MDGQRGNPAPVAAIGTPANHCTTQRGKNRECSVTDTRPQFAAFVSRGMEREQTHRYVKISPRNIKRQLCSACGLKWWKMQ